MFTNVFSSICLYLFRVPRDFVHFSSFFSAHFCDHTFDMKEKSYLNGINL